MNKINLISFLIGIPVGAYVVLFITSIVNYNKLKKQIIKQIEQSEQTINEVKVLIEESKQE